jgi:hypothetical protein
MLSLKISDDGVIFLTDNMDITCHPIFSDHSVLKTVPV